MAIEQLTEACWFASYPGDDDESGGGAHYATEAEARKVAASEEDPLIPVDVGQFSAPCWTVTCDGDCGRPLEDGEMEWTLHLPSRLEAEGTAEDYDWTVTAEIKTYCEADKPDGVVALVARQIPGQGTLDG